MSLKEDVNKGRDRVTLPRVSMDFSGIYLNRAMMDEVYPSLKVVRLLFDDDATPAQLGIAFYKDKEDSGEPTRAYSISYYPQVKIGKVSCKNWISRHRIIEYKKKTGKTSFPLEEADEKLIKEVGIGGRLFTAKFQ